jgi:CRP/FNR family transcriptional regulator, cyclic AMP receptor protein
MTLDSFIKNIFGSRQRGEDITWILKEVPLFSQLGLKELDIIKQKVYPRRYAEKEVVFYQGQAGAGMYIVKSGRVRIFLNYGSATEIELATMDEGTFFGELSLLDESPRSATAVALEPSEIIGFFRPDLLDLAERMPKTGLKIFVALSEILGIRLRSTNKELARLKQQHVELEQKHDEALAKLGKQKVE